MVFQMPLNMSSFLSSCNSSTLSLYIILPVGTLKCVKISREGNITWGHFSNDGNVSMDSYLRFRVIIMCSGSSSNSEA